MNNLKVSSRQVSGIIAILAVALLCGCRDMSDREPPAVPKGLTSVTGDGCVTLSWYPNTDRDLAGYYIYRSYASDGPYYVIGNSRSAFFVDYSVTNGTTYYYAVSAYDYDGNESDLSYATVFDTPRPAGTGVRIWDSNKYNSDGGYDFASETVQGWNDKTTDMYCVKDTNNGTFYMETADAQTDIQDFGYTDKLDDVNYAPDEGWSQTGEVELITGHSYIVWTRDNHFAKFRITSIGNEYVIFDWAYQIAKGNRELLVKPVRTNTAKSHMIGIRCPNA